MHLASLDHADLHSVHKFAEQMLKEVGSETARYFEVDAHACDDKAAEKPWSISEKMLEKA